MSATISQMQLAWSGPVQTGGIQIKQGTDRYPALFNWQFVSFSR